MVTMMAHGVSPRSSPLSCPLALFQQLAPQLALAPLTIHLPISPAMVRSLPVLQLLKGAKNTGAYNCCKLQHHSKSILGHFIFEGLRTFCMGERIQLRITGLRASWLIYLTKPSSAKQKQIRNTVPDIT